MKSSDWIHLRRVLTFLLWYIFVSNYKDNAKHTPCCPIPYLFMTMTFDLHKLIRRIVVLRPATTLTLEVGQVKGQGHFMVPIEGSCMPNINALSFILQKIWVRLKFCDGQTDGRTDGRMSFNVPHFCKRRGTKISKVHPYFMVWWVIL